MGCFPCQRQRPYGCFETGIHAKDSQVIQGMMIGWAARAPLTDEHIKTLCIYRSCAVALMRDTVSKQAIDELRLLLLHLQVSGHMKMWANCLRYKREEAEDGQRKRWRNFSAFKDHLGRISAFWKPNWCNLLTAHNDQTKLGQALAQETTEHCYYYYYFYTPGNIDLRG